MRRFASRLTDGLLSKDRSLVTGLVLGMAVWTLTRLADGVLDHATIERAERYVHDVSAKGATTSRFEVDLTNLSRAQRITDLHVVVTDPEGTANFLSGPPPPCAIEAPSPAGAECYVEPNTGLSFKAQVLLPGTRARIALHYQKPGAAQAPLRMRLQPGAPQDVRVLEPGIETFVARHQTVLLLSLLGATFLLLIVSVAAGTSRPGTPPPTPTQPPPTTGDKTDAG